MDETPSKGDNRLEATATPPAPSQQKLPAPPPDDEEFWRAFADED